MHHDSQLCAQLGHFIGSIAVVYCPHHQAWLTTYAAGDESDDSHLDHGMIRFGPFDSAEDVYARVSSELATLIRVRSRQWLAQRQEDDPTPGEPL